MSLERLYIHNYKSFHNTTIELSKMNIIVGENNSGKSNIVDVLDFIDISITKGISEAISAKGGFDNVHNYYSNDEVSIRAFFETHYICITFNENGDSSLTSTTCTECFNIYKFNPSTLGEDLYKIKQEDENEFSIISNSLIGTSSETYGIDAQKESVRFEERRGYMVPMELASSGTISFLSKKVAISQNERILVIDNIESQLNQKALDYLLEDLRESKKQIIVTTHSSWVVKYADLEEIIFIYRDNEGNTQSLRANKIENLEEKMEDLGYTLDDLIADGVVGGGN